VSVSIVKGGLKGCQEPQECKKNASKWSEKELWFKHAHAQVSEITSPSKTHKKGSTLLVRLALSVFGYCFTFMPSGDGGS
jgi:hypothetical protein